MNENIQAPSYNDLIALVTQLREQLEIKTTAPDVASLVADIAEKRAQVTNRSRSGSQVERESSHSSGVPTGATKF